MVDSYQLRMSLTVSGAVALGAYEGGALAALLHAIRPLVDGPNPKVRLDAIGAASAGSITGMLAARILLEGLDPVAVMRSAWVEQDSITNLRGRDSRAPLSIDKLRGMATSLMDPPGPRAEVRQRTPVKLSFAVAALRGLDYTLPSLHGLQPVTATTYVDYYTAEIVPGMPAEQLVTPTGASIVDGALASAANATGFPPYLIDRSADVARVPNPYAAVLNWPSSNSLWYTDGGTVDNEPLGRTLDLTNEMDVSDGNCDRLQVLVHPHPTGSPKDDAWADPRDQPTWSKTFLRGMAMQRTQSLFADLKQVEKTNTRLAWANELSEILGAALDALPEAEQAAVRAALTGTLQRMRGQSAALRAQRTGSAPQPAAEVPAREKLSTLLCEAVQTAANVGGKTETAVEVISPLVLPEARTVPVERLLSGEFLGHFGGFFDQRLRQADFDLGYSSTLHWLAGGGLAGDRRLDEASAAVSLRAATEAYQPSDTWKQYGGWSFGSLPLGDKFQMVRLLGHMLRVATAGLWRGRRQH